MALSTQGTWCNNIYVNAFRLIASLYDGEIIKLEKYPTFILTSYQSPILDDNTLNI